MGKVVQQYELQIGARELASWNRNIRAVNRGIRGIGRSARLAASVAMAAFNRIDIKGFVTDAAETYKSFEQEMKNTAAIAGATETQYARMEQAAREAGRTTTITAEDSAAALGYMSLAGWDAEKSIAGLLPILRLAESTGKDLQTTSDLVTDSMSALGVSVEDLDTYLDKLVTTNNNANTSAEQLMYALVKTGGSARVIGMEMDDLITATGVLANNGLKSAEAGTALNSILKRFGSNQQAQKALDKLGISLYNDQNEFIGFKELLTEINEAMPENAGEKNLIMSQLGGRFFSQLQYLLNSVNDSTKDTESTWDKLTGKIENADGALDRMNKTATSSLSASQKLLESAWADFQISAIDVFSEDAKDFMKNIASELPRLSNMLSDFEKEHHREISRLMETGAELVVKVGEGIIKFCDFVLDNGPEVAGVIGAIFGGKAAYGIAGFAASIEEAAVAAGGLIPLIATNAPLVLGIAGVAAAIGTVTWAITEYRKAKQKAKDDSLTAHFGDIALSASDIEEAVKTALGNDNYKRLAAVNEQLKETEKYAEDISSYNRELEKLNWKVEAGIKLSGADRNAYIDDIQNLVSEAQEQINSRQYTFTLDVDFLSNGEGLDLTNGMDKFYSKQSKKLAKAGKKLQKYVNKAWEDGLLSINEEKKITELLNSFNEIQSGIEQAQAQGKIAAITSKYADMTPESFDDFTKEMNEAIEELHNSNYEAFERTAGELWYRKQNDKNYTEEQYKKDLEEAQKAWKNKDVKDTYSGLDALMGGIEGAYDDELKLGYNRTILTIKRGMEGINEALESDDTVALAARYQDMLANLQAVYLDEDSRAVVKDFLESIKPTTDELEKEKEYYEKMGWEIPEEIDKGLSREEMLNSLTGPDAMWAIISSNIANNPEYTELLNEMDRLGYDVAPELLEGSIRGVNNLNFTRLWSSYSEGIQKAYNPGYAPAQSTQSSYNARNEHISQRNKKSNALGGIYNSPILTTFAEDGPEAAIPINGTPRARRLWEQTGRLMGAGDTNNNQSVTYSPQIIVQGNANKEDIVEAQEIGLQKFKSLYNEMMRQNRRLSFSGV